LFFALFSFFAITPTLSGPLSCGTYGPRYFINIGTSLQTSAYFSAPLAGLFEGPYLYGCTPSEAIKGNITAIFSYFANTFLVANVHWYRNGQSFGNVVNQYTNPTRQYPRVISSSQFNSPRGFTNFSFEYLEGDHSHLDTVSIFSSSSSEFKRMSPIDLPGLNHQEEQEEEQEELIELIEQEERVEQVEQDGPSAYNAFLSYSYNDPKLPYQATNVTRASNRGSAYINYSFSTYSTGAISKIVESVSRGANQTTFVYYNNNNLVSKICQVSCEYYSYDGSFRLTSITENGQTLASYSYNMFNGVSQIHTASTGLGNWVFSY